MAWNSLPPVMDDDKVVSVQCVDAEGKIVE